MRKKIFKKCTSLLVVFLLLISMVPPVYAEENVIEVQLNGENISFDVAPKMVNDRVMVPMRAVFEKIGANVQWDEQTQGITVDKAGTVIKLKLKSCDAYVTEKKADRKVLMDTAPIIVKDRTLVPVRFIAESLGYQVGWDSENKTVIIIDYNYFLDQLKTKASNFYEYATNQYGTVNSGEHNQSIEGSFKYTPSTESSASAAEKYDVKFNAAFNAKLNPENGSLNASLKITGLEELLKGSPFEGVDFISYNMLLDNNSFYVKSNLFALLEKEEHINIGDKWVKADIADLNIPDVTTLQDLKNKQSNPSREDLLKSFTNEYNLDVNYFNETQAAFNALVTLVDNEHFRVSGNDNLKVYKWNINKQDLINVVLNLEKSKGSFEEMTLEDLAEMKEFVDNLVFDFNMEVGVKNNIIVSGKVGFNMQMVTPEDEQIALSLQTNSQVLNPNNASYIINMPDPSEVIDFKDLQPDSSPENVF